MKTFSVYSLSALLLLSFFLVKCKKDTPSIVPVVTLSAASNITTTTASSGGTVTADGGAAIIEKGVCWSSTNTTPTTSDSKTSDGTGKETFSSVITGLKAGTTYFTHISHLLGTHEEIQKDLPPNIFLAYDGLKIEV